MYDSRYNTDGSPLCLYRYNTRDIGSDHQALSFVVHPDSSTHPTASPTTIVQYCKGKLGPI